MLLSGSQVIESFFSWFKELIYGASGIGNVLNFGVKFADGSYFTLLSLITFAGLGFYLGVAIVKWLLF